MRKLASIAITLVLCVSMFGCAKKRTNMAGADGASTGAGDSMRFYGSNLSEDERQLMAKDVYYFDYDRYEISEEDTLSLSSHAKKLTSSGGKIRVEGHTDERGSREYNIALADRRAKAIANILRMKGVDQNQISVVSYGKEKPANTGHDESAWSLNRRGAVVYE